MLAMAFRRLSVARRWWHAGAAAVLLSLMVQLPALAQSSVNPPANAVQSAEPEQSGPTNGAVPGDVLGTSSDSDIWRAIRKGVQGNVSIPDKKAGVLVQSEGDNWRALRNGPLSNYGVWVLLGTVVLLAVFFLIRGRIKVSAGMSGVVVTRFTNVERAGHWLLAVSFILLGLTGLNVLYGRYVLLPILGPEAFSLLTIAGKYVHNYLGFAFMAGLIMTFVMWVAHNFPNRHDLVWMMKGGGILTKSHPPAKKFNAGQKILFWLVMLTGVSLSLSGLALLFPFEFHYFSKTFAMFNGAFGTQLPTELGPIQEMQLNQLWHSSLSIVMMAVILGHIYIGTIGMQGAFDAMGSGDVDINWAKEHHSLWVEEVVEADTSAHAPAPAE